MGVFRLKYRDTRPILEVVLHDPAPVGSPPGTLGPVHDLTGSTAWNLHIWMPDGTKLTRPMVKVGLDNEGTLRYTWVSTDWDPGSGGPPFTAGGLYIGPGLPLAAGETEPLMEYEVLSGTERMTFPNADYDILRIITDIGQG